MPLTEAQKRQNYITALHRYAPTTHTMHALHTCPTTNLRALCAHHGLGVEAMDAGKATLWTLPEDEVLAALTWYAKQFRQPENQPSAWEPKPVTLHGRAPLIPPTLVDHEPLDAELAGWVPKAVTLRKHTR